MSTRTSSRINQNADIRRVVQPSGLTDYEKLRLALGERAQRWEKSWTTPKQGGKIQVFKWVKSDKPYPAEEPEEEEEEPVQDENTTTMEVDSESQTNVDIKSENVDLVEEKQENGIVQEPGSSIIQNSEIEESIEPTSNQPTSESTPQPTPFETTDTPATENESQIESVQDSQLQSEVATPSEVSGVPDTDSAMMED
ncbi:hypothetical protein BKA69DRAFT_1127672 [Paraphysoderma sedebokerense]|nr:hypothetical protein BKA69DRAFT_1127672 [Paraphysoderma sedebokerense]